MAPYYEGLCKDLKWQLDSDLLNKMKKANEEELKRLDDVLEDAEKSLGESEIRDAMMAKAEYLIRIGDKVTPHSQHKTESPCSAECYFMCRDNLCPPPQVSDVLFIHPVTV